MSLNEDEVRQAREITTNLSKTVEQLLLGFIDAANATTVRREKAIDRHIHVSNAFIEAHGSLADEFPIL